MGHYVLLEGGNWFIIDDDDDKDFYLGYFNTIKEAAEAYDLAAKKYFKDYARLNYA